MEAQKMRIKEPLGKLAQYCPEELLTEVLRLPLQMFPEEPSHVVPSVILGAGGLTLDRIFLASEHYLCDVRMSVQVGNSEFDFMKKHTIGNYRLKFWTHEVREAEVLTATFELATIELLHDMRTLKSVISYAGSGRNEWLAEVMAAFPVDLLLPHKGAA